MPGSVTVPISDLVLSIADISVRNGRGEPVHVLGLRYNATISAIEVRGMRGIDEPPRLASRIGASPLRIFKGPPGDEPREACVVHFETATSAFPFECDGGTQIVQEVVILRGLRVETKE